MGIFLSTPPSTDIVTVHMIASFDIEPQGTNVVESTLLIPHEAMYDTIQTCSDDHTNDIHLVASDPYHFTVLVKTFSFGSRLSLQDFSFQ